MSDNLPESRGSAEPDGLQRLREHAEYIHASGFAPEALDTVPKIMAVLEKGHEANIPPMQALAHIHIIKGVPTMSAELMGALFRRAGHKIRVLETTNERATVQGERGDDPGHTLDITFTIQEAEQARLLGNAVWQKYRPAMLRARATSALVRAMGQDVLAGISYTPEEVGEHGFNELAPPEYQELDPVRHGEVVDEVADLWRRLAAKGMAVVPTWENAYTYAQQSLPKAERTLRRLQEIERVGGGE